ncbi:MAG TPA: GntR family transcriptional regulator [Micromonosporaceae bacterium]|nr:GntR family transcriptional regulator [Micromonosporaceae bacterium]
MTEANPPYLRIVNEVRRRIASGELRPGDQVPSARRIQRDWGVAIATATKVLATLRREGLTTVRPGLGTVVAGPAEPVRPGRPSEPDVPSPRRTAVARHGDGRGTGGDLTRERIVRAAIAIADADGLGELSMRRIATDLGVATMSLYRHVPGKDDLFHFMIDVALGEERFPTTRPAGWRARLELCARLQWTLFRRHPWLAPAMSLTRPQLVPNALAHTNWVLDAFDETEVSLNDRMFIHVMLFSYVRGVATALEPEAEAERDSGMTSDEWMESQMENFEALLARNPSSALLRLTERDDFDFDLGLLFEFGLARLLDGVEVFQNRARGAP